MIEAVLSNNRALFLIGFALLMAALMWIDRKNVQRSSILFFRRTKRGVEHIDRIAKAALRFWKVYGTLGVIVGIITIFISLGLIGYSIFELATGLIDGEEPTEESGASLVLPGISDGYDLRPGVLFVPAEYWIISIAILMVVHEMSHGIIARAENFEINSVGWIVLGIIPGAFVEPKGEKMLPGGDVTDSSSGESTGLWDQGNWKSRLKVLCAGSWANYLVGASFLLLFFGMTQTSVFYNVQDDFPAQEAGMNNGTLYQINGEDVRTAQQVENSLEEVMPGDDVDLYTSEGNFTVTATEHPEDEEGGYLGILFGENRVSAFEDSAYPQFLGWLVGLFGAIAFLNIAIGLFNMLPAKPLDGGQVVDTLVREYIGEEYISYVNWSSLIIWLVVLGSIVITFLV